MDLTGQPSKMASNDFHPFVFISLCNPFPLYVGYTL